MTVTFMTVLVVQFVMVVLIRHRLGRHWLRRPVTVFVLTSVVYLGIAPALLAIPSIGIEDNFRLGIQRGYADSADLILSGAMLALTLGYLLTHPERTVTRERPSDAIIAAKVLDWRWLALASVPLTLLTASGRGYNDGLAGGQGTSLSTNLVVAFFIIAVVVTAAAFLLRHGTRWFLAVLIVQSVVLAVAGERTPVLMDAVALILMLLFAGARIPARQVMGAGLLTVLVILSISGIRAQQGRGIYYTNSGISTRVSALATGLTSVGVAPGGADSPGLVAEFATRMSSVDYSGAILQAISEGQPRLSPANIPESLLIIVPSFLWPGKLNQRAALAPAQLQIDTFGLQDINFIPGAPGLYFGFLTPAWLMILFGVLGAIFGWFERWLLRECTPARMVLLGGAVVAALRYEAGLPSMLVQMRSAVVLALLVSGVAALRASRRPARPRYSPSVAAGASGGARRGAAQAGLERLGQGHR
jgi:hypothetical protein